jgi:hypothetical protein
MNYYPKPIPVYLLNCCITLKFFIVLVDGLAIARMLSVALKQSRQITETTVVVVTELWNGTTYEVKNKILNIQSKLLCVSVI